MESCVKMCLPQCLVYRIVSVSLFFLSRMKRCMKIKCRLSVFIVATVVQIAL